VEAYVRACVNSLLNQTYPNLEIILVDDKSPDSSGEIADAYARTEARVRVVHKERNEGLNMARATGFWESSGEYVTFVDSDDSLREDCVRSPLEALVKNRADFVRFGMLAYKDENSLAKKLASLPIEREIMLDTKKDLFMTQFDQKAILGDMPMFSMTVWGALYTKRLVDTVDWRAVNYRAYEDNIWTLRILDHTSRAVYISNVGYLYRYDDSISNVLSKSITGNMYNGEPVGYLEGLDKIRREHSYFNKKYNVQADAIIENETELLFMYRADRITKAELWNVEDNAQYLPKILAIYQKRLDTTQHDIATKSEHIHHLESENAGLREELIRSRDELRSHLSIKRSAKLTLGNIKRRILKK
jgi:glycosyltransferase involved in cell wall biosynthesis